MEPTADGVFALVENVSRRASVLPDAVLGDDLKEYVENAWFVHDVEGRIIDVNPWTMASLGYTREEVLALRVSDIETRIPPGPLDKMWGDLELGVPFLVDGRHRRKDGTEFPVRVRLTLFESAKGELLVLAICDDVTLPR